MKTPAASILFAFVLLAAPGLAEEPEQKPAAVEMDLSFRIPQAKGAGISHTPAVVFTRDGERMLTATSDGQVVVFDVASRKVLKTLRLPEPATDAIAIDAAGRFVAWVLPKKGVAVLEIANGEIVARDAKLAAAWLAIAPDGRRIALTRGGTVEVRALATLQPAGEAIDAGGEVTNVGWSPDGKLLGWTTKEGRVGVRDVEANRTVCAVKKTAPMFALAFGPRSDRVAYGGQDNTIYQYVFARKAEDVISKQQPFWITCLGYRPDGKMIAVGDESCDIWLFALEEKKQTFHNKHHVECWLSSVAWAPDNETFLFGCRPNSHAGRPHLHMPLTYAEAARSAVSRESRKQLLAAIDAEIKQAKDEKQKALLENYRTALAKEEQVGFHGGVGVDSESVLFGAGAIAGGGADGNGAAEILDAITDAPVTLPLEQLPVGLRKLAEDHRKTLEAEMKKLQSDFCVNQWKVK